MLYAIPFLCFLTSLLWGHVLMSAGRREALAGLAALLTGLALWTLWREEMAVGLDVLLYTLALWGALFPALLALVLGAVLGWAGRAPAPVPVRSDRRR